LGSNDWGKIYGDGGDQRCCDGGQIQHSDGTGQQMHNQMPQEMLKAGWHTQQFHHHGIRCRLRTSAHKTILPTTSKSESWEDFIPEVCSNFQAVGPTSNFFPVSSIFNTVFCLHIFIDHFGPFLESLESLDPPNNNVGAPPLCQVCRRLFPIARC
jgi:hypothetical protein